MSKNAFAIALANFFLLLSQAAVADPSYKSSDIIQHFAPQNLGQTRGLCIGTEKECGGLGDRSKPEQVTQSLDLVIAFEHDSDILTPHARENLEEFGKALKDPQLSGRSFLIEGHTDAKGTERYNMALSERRAHAVVQYLTGLGIDPARLEARGFGKTRPRAPDPLDAANRRVETRLRIE